MKKNNEERNYQICSNCVMDTSDSKIVFDSNGRCDFCDDFYKNILPNWKPVEDNPELTKLAGIIKKKTKNHKYNCLIGFSGGADSSYLCYVAKKIMGLNPLALIVDTGWNLNVANENIDAILKNLHIDSVKITIDWEEMKSLQISFLKSGVPYQDLPQDHAIFASIYNYAAKHKIKYVFTGANNATEYVRPPLEWVYQNDLRMIKDIQKKYSKTKLRNFPMCSLLRIRLFYPLLHGIKRIAPLNYIPYDKGNITKFLVDNLGWKDYKNKHFEDRFTRWYEGYYLPVRFGFDKRRCYLSNLILTGELDRKEAIKELSVSPYSDEERKEDSRFISSKLGISEDELESFMHVEKHTFKDFKNSYLLIRAGTIILRALGIERKKYR